MKVALFHATTNAIAPVVSELQTAAPDIQILQYLDEGLLEVAKAEGLSSAVQSRLMQWIKLARSDGAAATLLTCSSFTPLVPWLRQDLDYPAIAIDETMFEQALEIGGSIEVVATLESAARTTKELLDSAAQASSKSVQVRSVLAGGAFKALKQDDVATHDRLVIEAVERVASRADVVVLAQASMKRVLPGIGSISIPVLSSPESAVRRLLETLAKPTT